MSEYEHLANEGYRRAMELLNFCVRAQGLIVDTVEGEQWLADFIAYLQLKVNGDAE